MAEQAARMIETNQAPTTDGPRPVLPLGDRGRAEAAALMWQWRNQDAGKQTDLASALRKKGLLQAAVGLAAAGAFFFFGIKIMAAIVATIASITLITALVSPTGAYAAIESALTKFAMFVGSAVAWIVLMPIFLGFFVPFGLIFRRGQKDPMKRMFVPEAASYWREREADADVAGRRRSQF